MFLFIRAADGVKERCGEEWGADQRSQDKRQVYVWLWSSHKNCPLTTIKQIQPRAITHTPARTHTHTHTHLIQFCLLKALKNSPGAQEAHFNFHKTPGGYRNHESPQQEKSNRNCCRTMDTLECIHMCSCTHTHTQTHTHCRAGTAVGWWTVQVQPITQQMLFVSTASSNE